MLCFGNVVVVWGFYEEGVSFAGGVVVEGKVGG